MDKSQAEFFGTAAHQLKTPVAVIQWCLETALESKDLKGHDRDMIQKAVRQANALGELISELSHFNRVTNHNYSVNLTRVDLKLSLEKAIMHGALVAEKSGVRFVSGPIERDAAVIADEILLEQALINLIDNAVKYSNEGGLVEVEMDVRKGRTFVAVRDHGIGISPAEQDQIFVEFYRGAQGRKHAPEGSGMGLALAKKIAEEFGGDITLESTLGKGSTFILSLPAA